MDHVEFIAHYEEFADLSEDASRETALHQ